METSLTIATLVAASLAASLAYPSPQNARPEDLFKNNAGAGMNYETVRDLQVNFGQAFSTLFTHNFTDECQNYGCHKGYCWAYCHAFIDGQLTPKDKRSEWCYTTRGYSQDFRYVRCQADNECNGCWKCAGSCTL